MTKNQYKAFLKVPETVLEIRAVKRRLSKEMEKLGWDAFHEKYRKKTESLRAEIERARQEKLAAKR